VRLTEIDGSIAQHIHVRLLPHAAAMLVMLLGQATHALISSEPDDCFSLQAQRLVPGWMNKAFGLLSSHCHAGPKETLALAYSIDDSSRSLP
jgi:hypothetical protein